MPVSDDLVSQVLNGMAGNRARVEAEARAKARAKAEANARLPVVKRYRG
jgi:hypothetical protein